MSTERPRRGGARRAAVATACAVLAVSLVAGCGSQSPSAEVDLDAESREAPAGATATPTPTGEATGEATGAVPDPRPAPEQGDRVEDQHGTWVLELPEGGEAEAAAQAFVDYMDVRTGTYRTGVVDLAALARVAVGQPLTDVQGYVLELQEKGLRTVGDAWFRIEPGDVTVRGDAATLRDVCMLNATVDVDRDGIAQESPPDAYRVEAGMVRAGPDTWLVGRLAFEALDSARDC